MPQGNLCGRTGDYIDRCRSVYCWRRFICVTGQLVSHDDACSLMTPAPDAATPRRPSRLDIPFGPPSRVNASRRHYVYVASDAGSARPSHRRLHFTQRNGLDHKRQVMWPTTSDQSAAGVTLIITVNGTNMG